ncbi:MAG: nucleotidyl transferase AbiEii/AbiGii toxin family protein [Candidatus Levybacteria bacterium]|nr:nucleotidyl transferase AbiEii/AbiGii toxin family protein [Candidatus Levybacteria bacterium]
MQRKNRDLSQEQLLKTITSLLEKAHIPYMVTGALSVIFYGRPRASHDIDFVIEAEEKNIPLLVSTFSKLPNQEFIVDPHLIRDAVKRKYMFNLLHLPTMLKLDFFLLESDEFDKSRFQRRKTYKVFGQKMTFASPEDTILIKLLWYKDTKIEKHLIDAAFIYQIQEKQLDKTYLRSWTKKHNTESLLKELKKINLQMYY